MSLKYEPASGAGERVGGPAADLPSTSSSMVVSRNAAVGSTVLPRS